MEILDSYKSMQSSFRSLPLIYPKEKKEKRDEHYFDPGKFYNFKPFYFHQDLGPMRSNLGDRSTSTDYPHPEWDTMRQSFQMIVRQPSVESNSSGCSDLDYSSFNAQSEAEMQQYYYGCNTDGLCEQNFESLRSGSRSSLSTLHGRYKLDDISSRRSSNVERSNGIQVLPKIQPIRIRKYFVKDSKKMKPINQPSGSDSSGISDCEVNKWKKPLKKKQNCKNINCENRSNVSRPATPLLESFKVLKNSCDDLCDDCGEAKLTNLGKISKKKKESINEVSDLVVQVPNICEKWADKHGQELALAMQKGLNKLSRAMTQ